MRRQKAQDRQVRKSRRKEVDTAIGGTGREKVQGGVMPYAERIRHVAASKIAAVYRGHRERIAVEKRIVEDQSALLHELAELRKKRLSLGNRKIAIEAARTQRRRLLREIAVNDAVAAQKELHIDEDKLEPMPFQWPGEAKKKDGKNSIRLGRGRMTMLMTSSSSSLSLES